jgi:putative membrane protein
MSDALLVVLWQGIPPLGRGLLTLWLLEMISVPIVTWLWGDRAQLQGIKLGVLLQASTVVAITAQHWGAAQTLKTALLTAFLAWTFEFIGSKTGIPFGAYHYTDRLRPQIGNVPVLIPFAWLMMLPPAWATAEAMTQMLGSLGQSRIVFVLLSGLTFTVWDLFLDPQMVEWRLWIWDHPSTTGYFGVPWTNYAGWFLCAMALTTVLSPSPLPQMPLIAIYSLTWFLETVGQVAFWHLPGPGLVGAVGMGIFVIGAWISL